MKGQAKSKLSSHGKSKKIKLIWEAFRPVCLSNSCEKSVNKAKKKTKSKKNWPKFMKVRNKSYFLNENTKSLLTLT